MKEKAGGVAHRATSTLLLDGWGTVYSLDTEFMGRINPSNI
jgi:hypothetical protein